MINISDSKIELNSPNSHFLFATSMDFTSPQRSKRIALYFHATYFYYRSQRYHNKKKYSATMNSLDMSFQLEQLMNDSSNCSICSFPTPPESLPTDSSPNAAADHYEFDCTKFAILSSSTCSTTVASSVSSLSTQESLESGLIKGWGSTLSRSRCVNNLSALGSVASESSIQRCPSGYKSNPNEAAWGYFVDTPHDK